MQTAMIVASACVVVLALVWRFVHCVHAWELLENAELPPPIEAARRGGALVHLFNENRVERMSKKTLVLAMRCPKCGAARIKKVNG